MKGGREEMQPLKQEKLQMRTVSYEIQQQYMAHH